jgi:hypothetical protein
MSESVTIFEALNNVKTAIGAVRKQERNVNQNFLFRGIDAVVNAAAPELNRHGVIVTPEVLEHVYETVEVGAQKKPTGHVVLAVKYTFWGPQGDSVSSVVLAEALDAGDKGCAKAMSVAYRIALLQTLNLPTDEPDPDSESFERSQGGTTVPSAVPSAVPRPVPKPAPDNRDWADVIGKTSSLDALRKTWKDAGAAGALPNKITVEGVNLTVQEYLYKRSDELTAVKSDSGS